MKGKTGQSKIEVIRKAYMESLNGDSARFTVDAVDAANAVMDLLESIRLNAIDIQFLATLSQRGVWSGGQIGKKAE
jgi:hypothetical protein